MKNGNQITKAILLQHIAMETANMASPGHFLGHVLKGEDKQKKKTKKKLIDFFSVSEKFPIGNLWHGKVRPDCYKGWHKEQIENLSCVIRGHIISLHNHQKRTAFAVAAKLLDTFMHQLMKYDRFRYLYKVLYLPLDRRALGKISQQHILGVPVCQQLLDRAQEYQDNPYSMPSRCYYKIQKELINLSSDCGLKARIELNCLLWA